MAEEWLSGLRRHPRTNLKRAWHISIAYVASYLSHINKSEIGAG